MPIDSKHPDYKKREKLWEMTKDSIEGEVVVKEKGRRYLPEPPSMVAMGSVFDVDSKIVNDSAYAYYQMLGEFPEIVGPTLEGFQGLIHSKAATVQLPTDMEYLIENATPRGQSLERLWSDVTRAVLATGRAPLLVDADKHGLLKLVAYDATEMLNWRMLSSREGAGLGFATIAEETSVPDPKDPFVSTSQKSILLLSIIDGVYHAQWFDYKSDPVSHEAAELGQTSASRYVPRTEQPEPFSYNGNSLSEIPLVVINSHCVGTRYGVIPMHPLAKRAMAIYRRSADYNRALYMKSDPQIVLYGVTDSSEYPTAVGGGSVWAFGNPSARAEYLDIDGQGIPLQAKAIQDEYDRFYDEGGKLLDSAQHGKNQSGEAIRRKQNSNSVTLKSATVIAASGVEKALRIIAGLMGHNPDDVIFEPDLDFAEPTMSPQDLLTLQQARNQGAPISDESIHGLARRGGLTEKDYEDERALIDDNAGFGGRDTPPEETEQAIADPGADLGDADS